MDERDDVQIWKTAVNILNKLSWTAEKEWSSSLGFGREVKSPHLKKSACYEILHRVWGLDEFFVAQDRD
jgi:hypothetical protein